MNMGCRAYYESCPAGLNREQIKSALSESLAGKSLRRVLLIPPDYTRCHSGGGLITNLYYHMLTEQGCQADILPALGSHYPLTPEETAAMFGDIPYETFIPHNWRTDVVKLGSVPGAFLKEKSEGLWDTPIDVEINQRVMDHSYDLILSIGQVVPHEVVGMANYSKNLFVGVGGSDMIHKSHMLGALYGLERILGRDHTPVRELFDYGLTHYLADRPIVFVLTVCTVQDDQTRVHGLFIGNGRKVLEDAIALSQKTNITFLPQGLKKCVAYLDPKEFRSTWVGSKAIYRVRMAMEDDGELLILAPGLHTFGEDPRMDALIRTYGYCGQEKILAALRAPEGEALRQNMGAAAHLIHGSVEGRFRITFAVGEAFRKDIESVGFSSADYEEASRLYDPKKLSPGWQRTPDGEPFYYIPNPAVGLWINRQTFSGGIG